VLINAFKLLLLKLTRPVKRSLVIFCDVIICGFSVWISFGLRLDRWEFFQDGLWLVFISAIGLSFPLFIYFGLYRAIFRYVGSVAFTSLIQVFAIYTSIFLCIFTLLGVNHVPRAIGAIQPILFFIGIGASRYFARHWLGGTNSIQKTLHRSRSHVLIYGAGLAGRELASVIAINKEMLVKGFIDDNPKLQGSMIDGILVYSNIGIQDLIHRFDITDVLLALPSVSQDRRSAIIATLNMLGVRVRTLPRLIDFTSGSVRISDLHDLDMNDLLGRAVVSPDVGLLEKNIRNQIVLVTGAGGSIGSELCRQIVKFSPKILILIDISEYSLYLIYEELKNVLIGLEEDALTSSVDDKASLFNRAWPIRLFPYLASVRDENLMRKIFSDHRPATIFHAAAYKHVPLVEQNPTEGIRNNVFGTLTCAQVSLECGVNNFILVSTDKAVRPVSVMGASKRIAEMILQAMSDFSFKNNHLTKFSIVRFGNVLGSSGSVAPLFISQIAAGGPITLTHLEVTRYFMTTHEAAQLVIQAGAMAVGGDVFVLDMGEPVRIHDLAIKMVRLSGLLVRDQNHPHGDIEIKVTGLRPGEKLYEELLIGENPQQTAHPKIMKAHEDYLPWGNLQQELDKLKVALDAYDEKIVRKIINKLVHGY
jgi:FlaA1/EpsC-like NDP-sugar epimerase